MKTLRVKVLAGAVALAASGLAQAKIENDEVEMDGGGEIFVSILDNGSPTAPPRSITIDTGISSLDLFLNPAAFNGISFGGAEVANFIATSTGPIDYNVGGAINIPVDEIADLFRYGVLTTSSNSMPISLDTIPDGVVGVANSIQASQAYTTAVNTQTGDNTSAAVNDISSPADPSQGIAFHDGSFWRNSFGGTFAFSNEGTVGEALGFYHIRVNEQDPLFESSVFSFIGQWTLDANGLATFSAVPVPAAVWLFGSGLVGLIGFGRRKLTHRQ